MLRSIIWWSVTLTLTAATTDSEIIVGDSVRTPGLLEEGKMLQELEAHGILYEILKESKSAYKIWNITNHYGIFKMNSINETCIKLLKNCHRAIPFYFVNITIEETIDYIFLFYTRKDIHYKGNGISFARELMYNRTLVSNDLELYLEITRSLLEETELDLKGSVICADSECMCGCVSLKMLELLEIEVSDFKTKTSATWEYIIFGTYIDPVTRVIIIVLGLILNGVLAFIFIKEEDVRTECNILICIQVFNNILMLTLYLPIDYMSTYHIENVYKNVFKNDGFISIQVLIVSLNTFTVLLLNIQRNIDVYRVLASNIQVCKLSPVTRCAIYISVVWIASIVLGIGFVHLDPYVAESLEAFLYSLIYLLVFSIVVTMLNSFTSRKLQKAALEDHAWNELQSITGSTVILSLTIAYYATHTLFYVYVIHEAMHKSMELNLHYSLTPRIIIFITHFVYFSYPIITSIALYKASSTFRTYLRKYLFRCWYQPSDDDCVVMWSAQNTEDLAIVLD